MLDEPRPNDEDEKDATEESDADTLPAAPSKNKDTALGDTDQHSTENA